MLNLSQAQLRAISAASYTDFETRSLAYLRARFPRRTAQTADAHLRAYVKQMAGFAADHAIFSEINVQRLMKVHLDHGFPIPLPDYAAHVLRADGFDEKTRVFRLVRVLRAGPPPVLVGDADDIAAIRSQLNE